MHCNDFTYLQRVVSTFLDEYYTEKDEEIPKMSYNTGGLIGWEKTAEIGSYCSNG